MNFLIRDIRWQEVRQLFDETEKDLLREAIVGQVICPAGWTVALDELPPDLRDKVRRLLA